MIALAFVVSSAWAVDVHIDKQSGASVHLFVDGKPQGLQRGHTVTDVSLTWGDHEVWLSYDPEGRYVYCYGTVTVARDPVTVEVKDRSCGGLKPAVGKLGTMSLGATVHVWAPEAHTLSLAVDGGAAYEISARGAVLDLAPGKHAIWIQDVHGNPVCQGVAVATRGETTRVVASTLGCSGLEDVLAHPPPPAPPSATSADAR